MGKHVDKTVKEQLLLDIKNGLMDRFWYLATVIDVRTREIVGRHVANHHTTALIVEAFKDAVRRTGTAPDYFRSDQGSEMSPVKFRCLQEQKQTALANIR